MNPVTMDRLKRALIASGATIAFIAFAVYAPLIAALIFLVAYLSNE